jgi:thiol-disulfide isomerase/thioredoxin
MAVHKIGFTIGLIAGVALTAVLLDSWGKYLDRKNLDAAQVHLLSPMRPAIQTTLPAAWVPESSAGLHDSWKLRTLDGQQVTLASFRGRIAFLNFWSTSCAPCIAEMPGIEALLNSVPNDQIAFLAVTQDSEGTVRRFLKERTLKIPIYLSAGDPPSDLLTTGIPTSVILDARGAAVLRDEGAVNWNTDEVRSYIQGLAK